MTRLTACLLLCLVGAARAQPVDTTAVASGGDVFQPATAPVSQRLAPPDSTPVPAGFAVDLTDWSGSRTPLVLPVVAPVAELTDVLGRTPGSFLYDLSAPGWPHGWSPDAIDPAHVGLAAIHTNWNDPLTGRPRFDLLPFEFFEPLEIGSGRSGDGLAVSARLRTFDAPRPVTELRYRRGAASLQAVAATHAQRRRVTLFGSEATLRVTGGYGGRASQGEYPGSRLRRERHVLTRVVLERSGWHVDLTNLHTRHQVGAHAGVLPQPGGGLESVYERFGARVTNERATRRSIRNDLVAELGLPVRIARSRPRVRGTWTAQHFRYRDPTDTLRVETNRLGIGLLQSLDAGVVSPSAEIRIESERARLTWRDDRLDRLELHAALRDTLEAGRVRVVLGVGLHRRAAWSPSVELAARYELRDAALFVRATDGGVPSALIHEAGMGPTIHAAPVPNASRLSLIRGGIRTEGKVTLVSLTGFWNQTTDPVLLVPVRGDTAQVVPSSRPIRHAGVVLEAGLRVRQSRGFYAHVEGTLFSQLSAPTEMSGAARLVPKLTGRGRGGMRYRMFRGDLDLHLFAEVRAWSEFESRTLHAPSGLLIYPHAGSPVLGPASTLSVYAEAGVRDATVFLAWENVLAGTAVMDGTMLVPVYPLPEQAFRFGVYWPIWD